MHGVRKLVRSDITALGITLSQSVPIVSRALPAVATRPEGMPPQKGRQDVAGIEVVNTGTSGSPNKIRY